MQSDTARNAPDRAVEAGRGALFIGVAKVFFIFSGLLQKMLLTRFLSPADFGEFSTVNALVSIVNNTVVQGTTQSISKFTAESDARAEAVKRAGLRLQLVLGVGIAFGFFLLAPLFARFYKAEAYTNWFRLVALIPLFYSFYSVFVGSANGLRRFRTQAGFDITFAAMKTILMAALALWAGVTGALAGFVVAALIILVVAARVVGLPHAGGEPFPTKRLAVFMVKIALYGGLINLALQYDVLLLRRFALVGASSEQAAAMTGYYESVRNISLLPYQILLVITFVIFPLVSRSTFENDRDATRVYVRQTLRYALILAAAMGTVLAARPAALLAVIFSDRYAEGAAAVPLLIAGVCTLALLGVSCSIINASGRPLVAAGLVAITVVVGTAAAFVLIPRAAPGVPRILAAAGSSALGMVTGFVATLLYLLKSYSAGPPLPTVLRVAVAVAAATLVGHFLPARGKILGLGVMVVVGIVFAAVLLVLREFGPEDRAKFRRVLRRS